MKEFRTVHIKTGSSNAERYESFNAALLDLEQIFKYTDKAGSLGDYRIEGREISPWRHMLSEELSW